MSNATIRDAAVAKINEAKALLAQIGVSIPPPPPPPPSSGTYGASLPARMAATTGTVRNVTTLAGLKTAVGLGGDIRITGTIDARGEPAGTLYLTTAGTAGSPNQISGGVIQGRITVNSNYWRIKNVEIKDSPYDGIKIADGANAAFIDIDNCWIHHVGEQGILSGSNTSADIQVWNCLIEQAGQSFPTSSWLYHCIYTGGATSRWTIGSNLMRPRNGFGIHLYPNPATVLCVANTTIGGLTRGGYAIRGATAVKVVGDIITGSPTGAFEITSATAAQTIIQDTLQWNNAQGVWGTGYSAAGTVTNLLAANPLLTSDGHLQSGSPARGLVQASRYPLLPALDRAGAARGTADAGCYKA